MYLKRFGFPSYGDEKGYLSNCDTDDTDVTPFGIFSQRGLSHIDFSNVTIFCGGSHCEKNLVLEIIGAKLGIVSRDTGIDRNMLSGYLEMCYTRYAEYIERRTDIDKIYISRANALDHLEKTRYRFDGKETLLHFYEEQLRGKTICLLCEPETGMSFEETVALACLLEDFSVYSKTQFILTTNSLALLGIKNALIYDFDDRIVMGRTWHDSAKAAKQFSQYMQLLEKHKG